MLTTGHTTSCGCFRREIDAQRDFKNILTYENDTCIELAGDIDRVRSNTSSETGVRGVRQERGKYLAEISFRKKRYILGRFTEVEDAIEARKTAESQVKAYIDAYLSGDQVLPTVDIEQQSAKGSGTKHI